MRTQLKRGVRADDREVSDVSQTDSPTSQGGGLSHRPSLSGSDYVYGSVSKTHAMMTEAWLDCTDTVLMVVVGTTALVLCLVVSRLRTVVEAIEPFPPLSGPSLTLQHATAVAAHRIKSIKQPWGPLQRPLVIAHRGASGAYPEHTREAYLAAIEDGADVIECDVVLTRDLVGLCRHGPDLLGSTDAATRYPGRMRWSVIDGVNVTGIFAADLTLGEVRKLRAVQPWPFRDQSFNGKFPLVTLDEYLDIALAATRTVAVYPETKNPTWHNNLDAVRVANTTIERVLLAALEARGYQGPIHSEAWLKQPAYIQSFETNSLEAMRQRTCLPLIQLMGANMSDLQPDGRKVSDLLEPKALQQLSQLVAGVGPGKQLLVTWKESKGQGGAYVSSGIMEKLHAVGLQVHPYTVRDEAQFILPHLTPNTTLELDLLLVQLGADGLFADQPNTTVAFLKGLANRGHRNMTLANLRRPCTLRAPLKAQRAGA